MCKKEVAHLITKFIFSYLLFKLKPPTGLDSDDMSFINKISKE